MLALLFQDGAVGVRYHERVQHCEDGGCHSERAILANHRIQVRKAASLAGDPAAFDVLHQDSGACVWGGLLLCSVREPCWLYHPPLQRTVNHLVYSSNFAVVEASVRVSGADEQSGGDRLQRL